MTNIEIPHSVSSIGSNTFYGCSNLTKVEINDLAAWCEIDFANNSANPLLYAKHLFLNGSEITELVIPTTITKIKDYAFYGCSGMKSATIPNYITSIGNNAFDNCSGLTEFKVDDCDTEIYFGKDALAGTFIKTLYIGRNWTCVSNTAITTGITSVKIGHKVTALPPFAFYKCTGLTSIEIPSSVTSIARGAFQNCTGLTKVEISDLAAWCGIDFADDSANPLYYAKHLHRNCSEITELIIPSTITEIKSRAFYNCSGLTSVIIGNGVVKVGDKAFFDCSGLVKSAYPNNLTNPFSNGATVSYPTEGTEIDESFVYGPNKSAIYFVPWYLEDEYIVPNSVTKIGDSAFWNCYGLTSVKIPNSVTEIGNSAFKGCTDLAEINSLAMTPPTIFSNTFDKYTATLTVPDGAWFNYLMTDWSNFSNMKEASGNEIFTLNDDVFTYRYLRSSGEAVLIQNDNYKSITSASIPDRVVVESGDDAVFYQVTAVAPNAFNSCSKLTQVKLPKSCTYIGESAFKNCYGLTKVEISDVAAWCGIEFGNYYANPLYYAKHLYLNGSEINELVIPTTITKIKDYAFYNCDGLKNVTIADDNNDISIGESAFSNSGVTALYLGRNISRRLGQISALRALEIGSLVSKIPENAFKGATELTSLTITPGVKMAIGVSAFEDCTGIKKAVIPVSVSEISERAFYNTRLSEVVVPQANIGAYAFGGNNSLKKVVIGAGVESVGEYAFYGANSLIGVYATSTTPPAAQNTTFSDYSAQLYVPADAIDTYYNNPRCWYRFSSKPLVLAQGIQTDEPTALGDGKWQFSAKITNDDATLPEILWRSTNPAIASVDNNGVVTIHGSDAEIKPLTMEQCEIIASTLYENGPEARFKVSAESGIESVIIDADNNGRAEFARPNDVYNMQGVLLRRDASQSDIDALAPGLYIIAGKKVLVK